MPWDAKTFASRHNHKLHGPVAAKAAKMANAMLRAGVPEGEVIATVNKHADKMMSRRKSAQDSVADALKQHGVK